MTTPSVPGYSLQQAQRDIADLRGQISHLLANATIVNLTSSNITATTVSATTVSATDVTVSDALKYTNIPVFSAVASSNLSVGASAADVPGATTSVTVRGSSSTVVVVIAVDEQTNATTSASVTAWLNWNGSDQTSDALLQTGSAAAIRGTVAQVYVITGVAAGTYTAKIRASGTTGGTVRGTHTVITAMVWEK